MAQDDGGGAMSNVPSAVDDRCNSCSPERGCGGRCDRLDGHPGSCRCPCGCRWGGDFVDEALRKYGKGSQQFLDAIADEEYD